MTNAERIKALRRCSYMTVAGADREDGYCKPCAYFMEDSADVTCIDRMMIDAADALEAADKRIAEMMPKEGEWIYTPLERYKEYKVKCPFCGAEYHDCYDGYIDAEDMNYCPNCGAKMRKGERQCV